jgi:hypothetical protein
MLESTPSPRNQCASKKPARRTAHARRDVLIAAALAAITLCLGPIACLSDVSIPDCARKEACGGGGAGGLVGSSGSAGMTAGGNPGKAGNVGNSDPISEAGAGGNAGTTSANDAGSSNAGSGEAGMGGAGCDGCSIKPEALPAPCGTNSYTTSLTISGGTPPYDNWQVTAPVGSWQITRDPTAPDGSRATLTGNAAGTTNLVIQVTDAAGEQAQQSYPILPRRSCWFAYTALETAGPRLELVDPILQPTPRVLGYNTQGVYDFRFSPDGKLLAYRFGVDATHPKGAQIALVNLESWGEQPVTFPADSVVTAYAWSGDSSVLAIAFTSGGTGYLGGVRPSASGVPLSLTATPAVIDSDLYWVGETFVAFDAFGTSDPNDPIQLVPASDAVTAFYAELGTSGFNPIMLATDNYVDPPVFVQPAANGFFMISALPLQPYSNFSLLTPGGATGAFHNDNFLDPSGSFSAAVSAGQLQIFRADNYDEVATNDAASLCPTFLAWAKGMERIACVADIPANAQGQEHSEIRIFDLSDTNKLTMSPVSGYCVKNANSLSASSPCGPLDYDYSESMAALQPRAFSASGHGFAFTTSPTSADQHSYVYWADLGSQPFTLKRKEFIVSDGTSSASTSPINLAFSPDEGHLLRQLGNLLSVHNFDAGGQALLPYFRPDPDLTNTNCSEAFASAPDRWCGEENPAARFAWSPDSRFAVYRSLDPVSLEETLTVVDFTQSSSFDMHPFLAADCTGKCTGEFSFQPQQQ